MNSKRIIRTGIVIALAAVSAVSCVTNRKIAYLQDMKHNTQIELENKFEAVISPYDELDVIITSFDTELARPFNLRNANNANYNTNTGIAYLVDQNGDIELPVLGTIHAAGLTRLNLQEKVKNLLIAGGYISDPYVLVRFRNFKIFFLGANGGKAITVPNERCTFLEALALSGDMNVYTNRDKIMVMREVDGKMVSRYLDPRSSKVFKDPFFMLQQNDFIITQNTGYRNFQQSYGQFGTVLSAISTLTGLATTYFAIMAYLNTNK
ncbi:MAG: polysaccharide biosynthesis/export family protein [Bacteroidales bacterium]|nr:polysaccharide biosynthesis/export family protein [Fibrobacter sp.]MBR3387196.1 polysaccharide biosynthesis/export family protein [Bacteroidales bacterium]